MVLQSPHDGNRRRYLAKFLQPPVSECGRNGRLSLDPRFRSALTTTITVATEATLAAMIDEVKEPCKLGRHMSSPPLTASTLPVM
jgi:hypothetical protein